MQIDGPLKSVVLKLFCGIVNFDSNDTIDSFKKLHSIKFSVNIEKKNLILKHFLFFLYIFLQFMKCSDN